MRMRLFVPGLTLVLSIAGAAWAACPTSVSNAVANEAVVRASVIGRVTSVGASGQVVTIEADGRFDRVQRHHRRRPRSDLARGQLARGSQNRRSSRRRNARERFELGSRPTVECRPLAAFSGRVAARHVGRRHRALLPPAAHGRLQELWPARRTSRRSAAPWPKACWLLERTSSHQLAAWSLAASAAVRRFARACSRPRIRTRIAFG